MAIREDLLNECLELPAEERQQVSQILLGRAQGKAPPSATAHGRRTWMRALAWAVLPVVCLGAWGIYQQIQIRELQQSAGPNGEKTVSRQDALRSAGTENRRPDAVRLTIQRRDPAKGLETTTVMWLPEKTWSRIDTTIREERAKLVPPHAHAPAHPGH